MPLTLQIMGWMLFAFPVLVAAPFGGLLLWSGTNLAKLNKQSYWKCEKVYLLGLAVTACWITIVLLAKSFWLPHYESARIMIYAIPHSVILQWVLFVVMFRTNIPQAVLCWLPTLLNLPLMGTAWLGYEILTLKFEVAG